MHLPLITTLQQINARFYTFEIYFSNYTIIKTDNHDRERHTVEFNIPLNTVYVISIMVIRTNHLTCTSKLSRTTTKYSK